MLGHLPVTLRLVGGVAVLGLGLIVARLLAWISALSERHKLAVRHTVIAEYDAPERLSPAELGYLIDATFGDNELLATVAQLYAKQAVQLQRVSDTDFMIIPSASDVPVQTDDGESSVLGYLRSVPKGQIAWSALSSMVSGAAGAQDDFDGSILQSLVGKGLLYPGSLASMLVRRRRASLLLAALGTAAVTMPVYIWAHQQVHTTGLSAGFMGLDSGTVMLAGAPLAVIVWFLWFMYANAVTYIYLHRDGVPAGATPMLNTLWSDVAGFRLFLQETEYVRLQQDTNPTDPAMAYCLALGLDPGFVKSLES